MTHRSILLALLSLCTAFAAADAGVITQTPACGSSAESFSALPAEIQAARSGWHVNLQAPGSGFPYTPTLWDCDGDGAAEIFLTGGHTFGLRGDGTFLPGWPTVEMPYMGYGTNDQKPGPSAADMDGDGEAEILWSERDWWAGSAHMWCFDGRNLDGSSLPGFPQQAIDEPSNALDVPFVLGDVDGDGDLEAWGPHTRGNNFVHYRVSAFDHTGARLFTRDLESTENILSLYFGNLDGAGGPEMFAVSLVGQSVRLRAFTPGGADQAGYPRVLTTIGSGYLPFGPPIVADLDGDADLEVLVGTWGSGSSWVHAWHHDATPCAGFPIPVATSSQLFYLALGDITGDGRPELIATDNHLGAGYRVHALDLAAGLPLPGWPYALAGWPGGFPTVVDIDDDGLQEVCVATQNGDLHAIASDGSLVPGFPLALMGPSISGVAAGDIDGDGLFELVAATWNGWVHAWDTTGRALPGRADWPLRGVNARNTGVFGDQPDPAAVAGPPRAPLTRLLHARPNPARTEVHLRCDPTSATRRVLIFDALGRAVCEAPLDASGRALWQPGPEIPAGVFTARAGGESVRLVLLR